METSNTRISLLARLRQLETNQDAWEEFVQLYGRKVFLWCRQWGLQDADAQDVTQNVLLALARQMKDFEYDPNGSFRAWLKTVAYRAWCKFLEHQDALGRAAGNLEFMNKLATTPVREDLFRRIEEAGDRELLQLGMERVRRRVQPQTWEAFRLLALENVAGAEVAKRLGMPLGSVYVAKCNVQKMLREELTLLDAE